MSTEAAMTAMHATSRAGHTAGEARRHASAKRSPALLRPLGLSNATGTRSAMAMSTKHVARWLSGTAGEDSGRHSSSHRRHARREVAWKFAVERLGVAEASDGERESETGEGDHFDRFVDCEMDVVVVVLVYCLLKRRHTVLMRVK